ncbi:MAG: hypothetical protein AAFU64_01560 [Bacteroidota bacterium]
MNTKKEIIHLAQNLFSIIESDIGREVIDQLLEEKFGEEYLSVKEELILENPDSLSSFLR